MKIGIELRQVTFGASGGIAQFLQGMLDSTFKISPDDQFIVFCTIFSRSLLGETPPNVSVETLPAFNFFSRIDQAAAKGEIDILFRSYPMEAPLQMAWDKQVVLIPDLQHDVYPEFFAPDILRLRRLAFNQSMARAGALITFTDYVRGTILAQEWTRCRDVFLSAPSLPLGYKPGGALSPQEQALVPAEDFFFYPANLWQHKNHRRVLQAFERMLARTSRTARMILTGHPDGWEKLRAEFPQLPVTHLGFVSEQLMQALMARAGALPFFSLHEGFGIPLLEAFHAGTPVICSNTTSLPEVGGDAALSCDPTDVETMSALMERILTDESTRAGLIERGKKRLSFYTWENAAKGLVEACWHVAAASESPSSIVGGQASDGEMRPSSLGPSPQPSPPSTGARESETSSRFAHSSAVHVLRSAPLVSIVTPSYNQGRFLKATIESVLTQSYPHIQYLVFDGGSKDESVDILKSYGDRFFWKSQKDKGQTDAINQGMKLADGQIQAYLNSDDVLSPGAVQRIVEHFNDNPECDMVYGRATYIDAAGNVTGRYKSDEYSFQRLMHDCCVCQPAAFWQARIARKIGPFDESLHCAMDYDYWLRIDRAGGRIQHIHDLLASSRLYADTKTMSLREKFYGEIFAICLKHGGYVDYNYFLGLWQHLVFEKKTGWPRWARVLPGAHIPLAWAHHKIFEKNRCGLKQTAAQLWQQLGRACTHIPLVNWVAGAGSRALRSLVSKPPRVKGFLADNWMQPDAQILLHPKAAGQKLRHIGVAPVDMQVTIAADDKVIGAYPLRGGEVEAIGTDIALVTDRPVRLHFQFSRHTVDAARRQLSFLVTETNLFGESDLR